MKIKENYSSLGVADVINPFADEIEKASAKTCPFCGGDAVLSVGFIYKISPLVSISCDTCGGSSVKLPVGTTASGKTFLFLDRFFEALNAWNRRA